MIKKIKENESQSAKKRVEALKLIQESVEKAARQDDRQHERKLGRVENYQPQKEEKETAKSAKKVMPQPEEKSSDFLLFSTPAAQKSELEETISREKTREVPDVNSPYVLELSQAPIRSLKKEMADIYLAVEEKGYISREEGRRVEYLSFAVERKLDDVESGKYSLTEEVARAASLTQKLGSALHDMYHHGKKAKHDDNNWYFRSG